MREIQERTGEIRNPEKRSQPHRQNAIPKRRDVMSSGGGRKGEGILKKRGTQEKKRKEKRKGTFPFPGGGELAESKQSSFGGGTRC